MMVVMYHSSAHITASGHGLGLLFGFGSAAGFAGVDVFFVISGFIMAWTTFDSQGTTDASRFARKRVARIYSGYWPFYLTTLVLFASLGAAFLANKHLLSSAVLWPTELKNLLLPVSWTLIFEMWFYLVFTLIVAFSGGRRLLVLKLLTIAVLTWSIYTQFGRQAYDPGLLENMNVYEQYLAFPYLLEFLAGSLLAYRLRSHPDGLAWSLLFAGVVLFILGAWINLFQFDGKLIQGYYIIWRVLIFGSASVLLVAGLVRLENRNWKLPLRFSLLAGGASYAIYLSHTLILLITQKMGLNRWLEQFSDLTAQAVFLILAGMILAYGIVHYRFLEGPLHRKLKGWLRV
jgi:exopolysaccharide production protein ExoZ